MKYLTHSTTQLLQQVTDPFNESYPSIPARVTGERIGYFVLTIRHDTLGNVCVFFPLHSTVWCGYTARYLLFPSLFPSLTRSVTFTVEYGFADVF